MRIVSTFLLTLLAWIFFRSATISDAFKYIGGMLNADLFSNPESSLSGYEIKYKLLYALLGIAFLLLMECIRKLEFQI